MESELETMDISVNYSLKTGFCRIFVEMQKYPPFNSLSDKELDKLGLYESCIAQWNLGSNPG